MKWQKEDMPSEHMNAFLNLSGVTAKVDWRTLGWYWLLCWDSG